MATSFHNSFPHFITPFHIIIFLLNALIPLYVHGQLNRADPGYTSDHILAKLTEQVRLRFFATFCLQSIRTEIPRLTDGSRYS